MRVLFATLLLTSCTISTNKQNRLENLIKDFVASDQNLTSCNGSSRVYIMKEFEANDGNESAIKQINAISDFAKRLRQSCGVGIKFAVVYTPGLKEYSAIQTETFETSLLNDGVVGGGIGYSMKIIDRGSSIGLREKQAVEY